MRNYTILVKLTYAVVLQQARIIYHLGHGASGNVCSISGPTLMETKSVLH